MAERAGLGSDRPGEINEDDDEFDQYRKRMMMAYRFRPNPMVKVHLRRRMELQVTFFVEQPKTAVLLRESREESPGPSRGVNNSNNYVLIYKCQSM